MAQTAIAQRFQPAGTSTVRKRAAVVLGVIALALAIVVSILVSISQPAPATRPTTGAQMKALQALHADADVGAVRFSEDAKLHALQRLKAGR
ncbi:MAG: hypothetical protein ACXVD9_12025 [Actinomycetota bacterium]